MYQVLASAEERPDILAQLEKIVIPVVSFTMEESIVEMFDDCFDLTDVLTFYQKKVSDEMWGVFRLMHKTFMTFGIDYLSGECNSCMISQRLVAEMSFAYHRNAGDL